MGVHDPRYVRPLDEEDIAFLTGLPERMPEGRVLLSSAPVADGTVPDDAAVWLQA